MPQDTLCAPTGSYNENCKYGQMIPDTYSVSRTTFGSPYGSMHITLKIQCTNDHHPSQQRTRFTSCHQKEIHTAIKSERIHNCSAWQHGWWHAIATKMWPPVILPANTQDTQEIIARITPARCTAKRAGGCASSGSPSEPPSRYSYSHWGLHQ